MLNNVKPSGAVWGQKLAGEELDKNPEYSYQCTPISELN